jgi:tRNA(Ile2) C34 agmatinyltransferase TiaS
MDITRCPRCEKRMIAVTTVSGRTDFQCLQCDKLDPPKTDAVRWAESPLAPPIRSDRTS